MRIGTPQAGSDSLLTAATFFKMREIYFGDKLDDEQFSGTLYGLGTSSTNGTLSSETDRTGATTAAERERGPLLSTPQQSLQGQALNGPSALSNGLSNATLSASFQSQLNTPFVAAMAQNPFLRNAMGTVGGDR